MTNQSGKDTTKVAGELSPLPANVSRRALIKGGVTAMPAILTLHSGAALARSSNMLAAASQNTTDGMGRTLCVDKNSVVPADDYREVYDLGTPPYAECNVIRGPTERRYFVDKNMTTQITPGAMCERGGKFYWKPEAGGHRQSSVVPKGFVASAGAMASVADYVKDTLI